MRLLILTQKVDRSDDVLGFMHRWLESFSSVFETITVVCLYRGQYALPKNVIVHSLGKERRQSRIVYLVNFYRYIWKFRNEYDAVVVHMNPEYVVLGGLLWKLFRKPVYIWYNHTYGDWKINFARRFATKIFHTSPFAYTASFPRSVQMPAGVDTEFFTPPITSANRSGVLSVGRLSPLKKIDVIIGAVRMLKGEGVSTELVIVGEAPPRDRAYKEKLIRLAGSDASSSKVSFVGSVSNDLTPDFYRKASVFVNITPHGNFDKTVLEAMSCGTPVAVWSRAFKEFLPSVCHVDDDTAPALALALERILTQSNTEQEALGVELREIVVATQSLSILTKRLYEELNS